MTADIPFKVGDIVTRDGTDLHRVVAINEVGDLIDVECIKEPLGWLNDDGTRGDPWCRLGEVASNLLRRYEHAGAVVDNAPGTVTCTRASADLISGHIAPRTHRR